MSLITNNPYSHLTAIQRKRISSPARILLERGLLHGEVLDFGCGYGKDVEALESQSISVVGYDPYYAPGFPEGKRFDTIMCTYVLDVLLPQEQMEVLMEISQLLKPDGRAYFAVERAVKTEGFRSHKVHRLPTYQGNVRLPYASIYRSNKCEIYQYWPYAWLHRGNAAISPFFAGETLREMIVESTTAFAIRDDRANNKGHVLVIPKRLVADYFDLSVDEQMACWVMVNRVKRILAAHYPDTCFDVLVSNGGVAAKTAGHTHIRVAPRLG